MLVEEKPSRSQLVQQVPISDRKWVKRLLHENGSTAIGYLIDTGSAKQPILLAGRSNLSELIFQNIITLPSVSTLRRDVVLLCVDVLDELHDHRRFEDIVPAENGFWDRKFLVFYPRSNATEEMLTRRCQKAFIECLRFLIANAK